MYNILRLPDSVNSATLVITEASTHSVFARFCIKFFSLIQKFSQIFSLGGNMSISSRLSKFSAVSAIILSLCFSIFADTIRLRDGSIVKGRVITFRDGQFVVLIGDGNRQRQVNYYADEIAAIEFDSNNSANSAAQTPSITTYPAQNQPRPNVNPNNQPVTQTNGNPQLSGRAKPILINSKVLADNTANGWTNTGWVVKKGQKIRITGTGRVSLGNGRYTTPSGIASLPDNEKLMRDRPTGGLIAVIGDDNNDFIFVGSSVEFTATRDGSLFLGVNEGYLDDNSGAFEASIEIDPNSGN